MVRKCQQYRLITSSRKKHVYRIRGWRHDHDSDDGWWVDDNKSRRSDNEEEVSEKKRGTGCDIVSATTIPSATTTIGARN